MQLGVLLPPIFGYDEDRTDPVISMPDEITVRIAPEPQIPFVDATAYGAPKYVKSFDDFIGQEAMKRELGVYIDEAIQDGEPFPHALLASSMPGIGKTTLAELIAQELRVRYVKLVPPFSAQALYQAALSMDDCEMLFIDEIHKLADQGPRAAENLYHMMEEGVLYLEDGAHRLARFTVMGATTDADKLPEPILDRFMIKPYFQPYNIRELELITENFAGFYGIDLDLDVIMGIARACRGTPRVARELVVGARALGKSLHRPCTLPELLEFKQVEPNGLTRQHIAYLVAMINHFGNRDRDGKISYIAGEATLMSVLRENKIGLSRLERYLIERGLLDRTPHGRRLTDAGIQSAVRYGG